MQALTATQQPESNHKPLESLEITQRLICIDPGPIVSAWLIYDVDERRPIEWAEKEPNAQVRKIMTSWSFVNQCVIEGMQSFGMPVGQDVLDTCVEIGRFVECWQRKMGTEPRLVYRKDIKHHLCNSYTAKDKNIRQALLDRWGPRKQAIGTIKHKGPLYGISGHVWSSLAVAVYATET